MCFWSNCALGRMEKDSSLVVQYGQMRLALAVFLADKALHPIVQVIWLFLLLFFSGVITLMVMVGNLCALLFTSGGILHLVCNYALVTDCDRFCKLYNLQTSTWALLIKIYVNFRRENDLANLKDAVIKCLNLWIFV